MRRLCGARRRIERGGMAMDKLIHQFDGMLRAVFHRRPAARNRPGARFPEAELTAEERALAAALMRVNHCGEVCAQALYQSQALGTHDPEIRSAMCRAADEEADHLAWTGQRIRELGGRPSLLCPAWYAGAFLLGLAAARAGKGWNLGFLAETERQVAEHLAGHLARLPSADRRSRAILLQMMADESEHARAAVRHGAQALPLLARVAMTTASRVMTEVAFRI